ncbi:MAG: LuxR C-terminal-related transcriptional regulator [Clostridiales bacterium]|nr:LuxR C-terminal-related transcriptional regulator [Clostridiales bacterium]
MLASKGWTNKEIASHLNISVNTVSSQITCIFRKLNITQRSGLSEFMLK